MLAFHSAEIIHEALAFAFPVTGQELATLSLMRCYSPGVFQCQQIYDTAFS
jgi:hypothetical protein